MKKIISAVAVAAAMVAGSANANVINSSWTSADAKTPFTASGTVAKYVDSIWQILTGITVTFTGDMLQDITLTNKSTTQDAIVKFAFGTFDIDFNNTLGLDWSNSNPVLNTLNITGANLGTNVTVPANSTVDSKPAAPFAGSTSISIASADFSKFFGNAGDTFGVGCVADGAVTYKVNSGNVSTDQNTIGSCGVNVTYTYSNVVPEPTSIALLGLGLLGLAGLRRRQA